MPSQSPTTSFFNTSIFKVQTYLSSSFIFVAFLLYFSAFFLFGFHSLLFAFGPVFCFFYGPASLRVAVGGYAVISSHRSYTMVTPHTEDSSNVFSDENKDSRRQNSTDVLSTLLQCYLVQCYLAAVTHQ
jgi:hypothetical protein